MRFKYRPLPDLVTIKPSKIDGLGLFATQDIPKPRIIGRSHVQFTDEWERTPVGGFLNHSDTPICVVVGCYPESPIKDLYTIKPIKKGEELTVYYTIDQE